MFEIQLHKRITRLILVSLLFGITTVVNAESNLQKGIAAFEKKQYDKAFSILHELSLDGNAKAQYYVAMIYNRGNGVMRDVARSQLYLSHSAKNGHTRAQFILACAYEDGRGRLKDYNQALHWYKQAALQGHRKAQIKGMRLAEQMGDQKAIREFESIKS